MSETTAVVMGNEGNDSTQATGQVTTRVEANFDTKRIEDMLARIEKANKKQVAWARTAALFMILLFLVIGGSLFIMVPQIMSTLRNINVAVNQANEILAQANDLVVQANEIAGQATDIAAQATDMLEQGNQLLSQAEGTLVEINTMSTSLTTTSDQVNTMLTENAEALSSSIAQIEAIDFEGLNAAIGDVKTTIEPLAGLMSKLNKYTKTTKK